MASTSAQQGSGDQDIESAATEQTPLLPNDASANSSSQPQREVPARSSLLNSLSNNNNNNNNNGAKPRRRWPSLIALAGLCVVVILIIVFAFLAPSTVEEYAQQAAHFEPTSLSIDDFTSSGVRARVQGDFVMDAGRVERKAVRDLGRFFTSIARQAETGESEVEVSLPEYGNVVLGTAWVPGVKVDLRSGHTTHVDVFVDLEPGDVEGIRRMANDWLEGRLGQLRVLGKANVPVKSGIISLGAQALQRELVFANKDIPSLPAYNIKKLNFREIELPKGGKGMAADVSIAVANQYPVDFTIPPLAFDILVDNCHKNDPYIKLADAETHELHIEPKHNVKVEATGIVHEIPELLTQDCPGTSKSPLDILLGRYMKGKENTIYVRGASSAAQHEETPQWIIDLMKDITVPVPFPGKTFGHLIKNFSLTDTHFSLPDPFADPDSEEGNPRISAEVKALIALPEEMNFNLSVSHVRADADIFYHGKKLGKLDLHRWQTANSTRIPPGAGDEEGGPMLLVSSSIKNAPVNITNDDLFTRVVEDMLFGGKKIVMHIQADVDVEVESALGELVVRKIPAEGEVEVGAFGPGNDGKPPKTPGEIAKGFRPKVFDLNILETTRTGIKLSALVNMTNPTVYSATVPYIDIHILNNGSILGHATARNVAVAPGENGNLKIEAVYDPAEQGGKNGKAIGRELLSQYISGYNTTLTLQLHEGSLPTLPGLGKAMSKFALEMPTPKLGSPSRRRDPDEPTIPGDDGDKEDNGPHFISDATFHLFTSTATFVLSSPLRHQEIVIHDINATAFYKGSNVGSILYDLPFAVPPVDLDGNGFTTPRLPVDWSLGSVGYEAVKNALGGRLKLAAEAEVAISFGRWREKLWFKGKGIGAGVRL